MDVCGRNAELTLQSRVKGFRKQDLRDLLYLDRRLVDYLDKELAIWPREDWPYFSGYRARSMEHGAGFPGIPMAIMLPGTRFMLMGLGSLLFMISDIDLNAYRFVFNNNKWLIRFNSLTYFVGLLLIVLAMVPTL